MTTMIETTVTFDGQERSMFRRVEDWWPEGGGMGSGQRQALVAASHGNPMGYGQLVALLNCLDDLRGYFERRAESTSDAGMTRILEERTIPAISEALRIVISVVAMDEVMFGAAEVELGSVPQAS